jgi:hypothetical protein
LLLCVRFPGGEAGLITVTKRTDKEDQPVKNVRKLEDTMRIALKPHTYEKALWIAVFGFVIPIVVGVLFRFYLLLEAQPVSAAR